MKTVFSPKHAGHAGNFELVSGSAIVPAFEMPSRAEFVKARIEAVKLGPIEPPKEHDLSFAKRVHTSDFIDFMPTVWPLWQAAGRTGSTMPFTWPTRGLRGDKRPDSIDALLGFYSFDAGANFVASTWDAVKSSYDVALSAAKLVKGGEPAAFALCRPPGHHAGAAFMGGYCFINNAAVAAQWFRDQGAARVSILDVDYHHGNGTQAVFWERSDLLTVSLHADPRDEYPYFSGHAAETGAGPGEGSNVNLPLALGTDWNGWSAALDAGLAAVTAHRAEALVVALGVDTYEGDPISRFRLASHHYPRIGARIAALGLPTVVVLEGDYAVDAIGANVVGVLTGLSG